MITKLDAAICGIVWLYVPGTDISDFQVTRFKKGVRHFFCSRATQNDFFFCHMKSQVVT